MKIYKTETPLIGYCKEAPNQWSFVDMESTKRLGITVNIGPKYPNRQSLVDAIPRFIEERC